MVAVPLVPPLDAEIVSAPPAVAGFSGATQTNSPCGGGGGVPGRTSAPPVHAETVAGTL
jgi:hypothetical protein